MPLGSNPDDYTKVVLKMDKDAPAPVPTFRVRFITDAELCKLESLKDEAVKALTEGRNVDALAIRQQIYDVALIGWDDVKFNGVSMKFGEHKPGVDFLSRDEGWELMRECIIAPQITERDRRNFSSPSGIDGADSASATAESASTPQPPNPQSP